MKYLSMCAVLRNEALYLKEWLDFYIKQGVEHFYLYDNDSTDNGFEVVRPYKEQGLVTWHETKGLCQQRVAYNHTIREFQDQTEWCCFFDIDEFGFCPHRKLNEAVKQYDSHGVSGLAVHWLLFGSSGHLDYS